ncbi:MULTISPECIES: DUF998 domain-containing protein [Streptomyces]|uniref:DUF998 domain-containing protein n=1 Tax=Streptomyces lycii TaxID=2654337 RepID=A0ABQ7F8X2_9ACTN|nr:MULTISPECIES: DUF998 domain-containing protein [Streptomyces]KAF4405391.1 DUF998 domain-containing protein [Streptomyces lycii]PGH47059.1 hypothetical protein CRI70_30610 [Streptomyces sp. Ru87]
MEGLRITRNLAVAGFAGSLAGAAALHIGWAHRVDTVRHTFSDYALSDGAGPVFTGTVACLTAGSTVLLAGIVRSGLPVGAPARALLGAWCGGLALTAVCRTDPPDGAPTVRGLVHRYAAGAALAALPAAGLLIAGRLDGLPGRRATARSLRRTSWAGTAAGLGFLCAHLCTTAPDTPARRSVSRCLGLAERVTLGLETGLLFLLAGVLRTDGTGT